MSSVRVGDRTERRQRRGFTLLELVVVLIMIALIAGMAVPRLNYERYRVDAAMRGVRAVLQGAQRQAIMRQTNVVVAFNDVANVMEVIEDADNDCQYDNGERLTTRPLEEGTRFDIPAVSYGAAVSAAVTGPNLCTIRGLRAVQFLRDGASSSDADIYLTSGRGTQTDFRLVRVTMASGRADAFRFNGTTWVRAN